MTNSYICIVPYFNFFNNVYIRDNFIKSVDILKKQHVNIVTIEAFNNKKSRFGADFSFYTEDILWYKENLVNIAISNVRADYYIFMDSGLFYKDSNWIDKVVHKLQNVDVVQCFKNIHFLDVKYKIIRSIQSELYKRKNNLKVYNAAPGGVFAIKNGTQLYDKHIVGAGDTIFLASFIKKKQVSKIVQNCSNELYNDVLKYVNKQKKKTFDYLDMDIFHLWHGHSNKTESLMRRFILSEYNPNKHVKYNKNGLLHFTHQAPRDLIKSTKLYLQNRKNKAFLL